MNKNPNFKTPEKNSDLNKSQIKSLSLNNRKSSIKILTEISQTLFKYITDIMPSDISSEKKEKISNYFNEIFSSIKKFSSEKKNTISKYDSLLRLSEEKIRSLYSTLFNMKIKITFLENNIDILLKKEKEYRLVKEKTGILVENGVIIHNDRKEHEIFILRTENSNLKNVIKEKDEKIKELNDLNNKYLKENNSNEKKIDELNRKIEQIKHKFKIKNNKIIKGHSCSCIDLNNMNINECNNSTKFNITVNNSLNKGNGNKFFINGIINNNNYGTNNNIYYNRNDKDNIHNIKRKYNSNLLNYNYMSLIHCQSMGNLNLNILSNTKSKLKSKSKSKNKTNINIDTSKNKNSNMILNNINVSPIHHKKKLCYTPHNNNNNDIINKTNFNPIKKTQSKNNSKSKSKKKKKNINTITNGIKVIYNSKTKVNKNIDKDIIQKKLITELTWSQNASINNSVIPKSTMKLNKRIKSKRSSSKQLYNNEKDKNKKNNSLIIMNISGKESVQTNKTCLSSIRRKNTINTSNNSFYSKNNFNL